MRIFFPDGFHFTGRLEAVKGRIERSLFEPQEPAAGLLEPAQNLQPVGLAVIQCGEDHRLKMAAQFVALNRVHAIIIDRLGIKSQEVVCERRMQSFSIQVVAKSSEAMPLVRRWFRISFTELLELALKQQRA